MSFTGPRALAPLLALVALPFLFHPACAADPKRPATKMAAIQPPEPTGAELVGKMLREQSGPSNPDVPLPQQGLGNRDVPASTPLAGPQVFGRREDGGGVFGLKIPIPAGRSTN